MDLSEEHNEDEHVTRERQQPSIPRRLWVLHIPPKLKSPINHPEHRKDLNIAINVDMVFRLDGCLQTAH